MSETTTPPAAAASDAELLKQKKAAAKAAKTAEKTEKKAVREERVHTAHHGKAARIQAEQRRDPKKMHGKKYRAAAEKITKGKLYTLAEAVELLKQTVTTKFDSSVEVHARLGIDSKKSDQIVRATVALPHGTGKTLRVVAFVSDDKAAAAKAAGAIEAGEDDLIEKVSKGWLDFDVAVATPDAMKKIAKIARTLGQKGLMPNPKAGTVTVDIESAIAEIKRGKVEFRNDKTGILHNTVGKASFDAAKLTENLKAYLKAVQDAKPKAVKGVYIASLVLTTTMGPSVKVDAAQTIREL